MKRFKLRNNMAREKKGKYLGPKKMMATMRVFKTAAERSWRDSVSQEGIIAIIVTKTDGSSYRRNPRS